MIKYPTTGCPAGYWAPTHQCKDKDYLVDGMFRCYSYAKNFVARDNQYPSWPYCASDGACDKCCDQCASNTACTDLTPKECTPCPPNSHSQFGSTTPEECICNAGYGGPAGGPCVSTGRRLLQLPEAPAVAEAYVCVDCPANSQSPSGSFLASACTCNAGYSGPAGGPCTTVTIRASPSRPVPCYP